MCPCREQIGLQMVHKSLLQGFRDVANSIHCILQKYYNYALVNEKTVLMFTVIKFQSLGVIIIVILERL